MIYNKISNMKEMEAALTSCSNSAPGKENITFEMLKHLHSLAKLYLLQYYNLLWLKVFFPKLGVMPS